VSGIPRTKNGLCPFECVSALQKYIRRGMEAEAMEIACEMARTSKNFASWVMNRLAIISHEDIGLAEPSVIPLVECCVRQAKDQYDPKNIGNWALIAGTAIRALCRAKKSREGDHFAAVALLQHDLEGKTPQIPEWVLDNHTQAGRAKNRGVDYFQEVSAVLVPAPEKPDLYEAEAYRLWREGEKQQKQGEQQRLFL